jgi:protein FRA10AC1
MLNEKSGFKTDYQILKENFKFIWDKNKNPIDNWEENFAKRYYDKLYKEYCIAELSRYKEGKYMKIYIL